MRKLGLGLLALSCGVFAGCTAILGTFEVAATESGTDGGGSDAPSDTSNPGDGGADADAPDPANFLLNCNADPNSVRVLDSLPDAGVNDRFDRVYIVRTQQLTRVVTRKGGEGGFRVYSFDPKNPGQQASNVQPDNVNSRLLDVRRAPGGMAVLTAQWLNNVGPDFYLKVWFFDDAGNAPTSIQISTVLPMQNSDRVSGQLVPMGTNDYVAIFSNEDTGRMYALRDNSGGGAGVTPKDVASGLNGGAADVRDAVAAGGKVFIFDSVGPEPNKPEGTGFYVIPDNYANMGSSPKKQLSPVGGKPHMLFGSTSTGSALKLLGAELDVSVGAKTPVTLRGGDINMAKFDTFTGADLPVIGTFDSLGDVPFFDGNGADFYNGGDDVIAIGGPPGGGQGANFYWYSLAAKQLRARNGSNNRLLGSRTLERVAVTFQAPPVGPFANLDVVWTEKLGGVPTLATAGILCVK